MARKFTVAKLVTRARQRSDMENDDLLSDSEWKSILSSAYGEFYSLVAETGMRYFESEQTITSDGTGQHALPADHLSTIGVDYEVDSAGTRRRLCELMVQERNRYSGITGTDSARAYALVGSNLELYPTPRSGDTYYHVYVPQPDDLSDSADATEVDVITPDGEAFIVAHMAVNAKEKEESDVRGQVAERERMRQRVWEWAVWRALNDPRRRIVEPGLGGYEEGDYIR